MFTDQLIASASMLRLAVLVSAVLFAVCPASANPTLVIDVDSGAVLHADQAGVPWYPASLTKLMTAYVTFERLRDDDTFTLKTKLKVSKAASDQPASKMGVPKGSAVTVSRALDALIIYSANDIAVVLAEGVAGSIPTFVERMNRTARRLGMTATTFKNPNGLPDDAQTTTARDMAVLSRALIVDFPEHASIFANPVLKWGKRRLRARNSLLRTFSGTDGMKTGFICASGYNVVATATRDGKRLMAVVLGASSGNFRSQIAAHLLETAFARKALPLLEHETVTTLSNQAARFVAPENLRPQICAKSGAHPKIAKQDDLEGWGALLAQSTSRKAANAALRNALAALRGIIDHGTAAVVSNGGKEMASVLAGLSVDEALDICNHLAKAGMACTALAPGELLTPKSANAI